MRDPSPCTRECTRRSAGCAVTCPDWAAYTARRDAEYAARVERCNNLMKTCGGESNIRIVRADAKRGRRHWK